jgi:peptide deformylase
VRSTSTSRPWIGRILDARQGTQLFNFFDRVKEEKDPGDVMGTKLKILKYPHPQLRAENEEVTVFDERLADKARQMLLVMYAADGIGLAAPQVGINQKLMVFNEMGDPENVDKEMILVNPSIISKSEDTNMREEGCLSFPQINGEVERSISIDVEYQTLTGEKKEVKLENLPARIFQHEYDHLDKVLFIDRFEERDQKINKKRLDKYIKKYGPGGAP